MNDRKYMCIKSFDNTLRQRHYITKIPPLNKGEIYNQIYVNKFYGSIRYQSEHLLPLEEWREKQIDKILENV